MGGGFLVEPQFSRPAGRDLLYHSHPHLFVGREILSALRIVKPQTVVLVEPHIEPEGVAVQTQPAMTRNVPPHTRPYLQSSRG